MADPTPASQPEANPPSQTYFGVIFDLNGQILPVSNQDVKSEVKDIQQNGIDFKMPTLSGHTDLASSTRIGSIGGSIEEINGFLSDNFGTGVTIPVAEINDLPDPLNSITKKILSAVWYVQKFEVHIKGKQETNGKNRVSVAMSAIWDESDEMKIVGSLKVKGFFFAFSNNSQS